MFLCAWMMLVSVAGRQQAHNTASAYLTLWIQSSHAQGPGLCGGAEHHCKVTTQHEILKYYVVQLRILIQGRYHYVKVVICKRSSGGLSVKIKSRLSGELLSRAKASYSRGRVLHCMQAAWTYSVAGHSNPRPKHSLLVLFVALFIVIMTDAGGSDKTFKAWAVLPLKKPWKALEFVQ